MKPSTKPASNEQKPAKQRASSASPSQAALLAPDDDEDGSDAKKDNAKASLEEQLQQERDRRVEERFVWIVVCVILVDVLWFRNAPNPAFPIVILLLEAVILFILAKRMGIEEISLLFERLLHSISRTNQ